MKPVYGNHLGWVINTQSDPEERQRVQVFVPYLTNTLYKNWNQELINIKFKNPNELGTETLLTLQKTLPWAECAQPIWGDGTSMKLNGPTGVLRVNGNSTFNPGPGVGGLDNVLSSALDDTSTGETTTSSGGWSVLASSRDQLSDRTSTIGNRIISLDFNSYAGASSGGALIVIPDNATSSEVAAARAYVTGVQNFMSTYGGISNYPLETGGKYGAGIRTRSENGNGMNGYFHTEPFFSQNTAAANTVKNNSSAYANLLANTLGSISGARFIAPHTKGAQGAAFDGISERQFALDYIIPNLESIAGDSTTTDSTTETASGEDPDEALPPVDAAIADPEKYMGLDTDESGEGTTGSAWGNATSYGSGNATRFSDSGGVFGTFDSSKPNIGIFPWTLESLSQTNPELVRSVSPSDPYYKYSKYTLAKPLYATFTYNGKTYGALVNDVGSAYGNTTVEGSARLFDIAENGSLVSLLGIGSGQNLKGVENFSISNAYSDQPLGLIGDASGGTTTDGTTDGTTDETATDETTEEDTSSMVVVNRTGNQGSEPDATIGGQGSPNGMFSVPAFGAKVWVFFYDGDVQRPVYFAAAIEPSSGQTS